MNIRKIYNEISKFCEEYNITEKQFFGEESIDGNLDLTGIFSIIEGFNPILSGSLDINSVEYIPEGFNPKVGGSLSLNKLKIIPLGFNPIVSNNLCLIGLESIPKSFKPIVGGYLNVWNVKHIPENLKENVYGDIIFNENIGYPKEVSYPVYHKDNSFLFEKGKYIKADNVFGEVICNLDNIYEIKEIGKNKYTYIIKNDDNIYSYGETIAKAKNNLETYLNENNNYKRIINLRKEERSTESFLKYTKKQEVSKKIEERYKNITNLLKEISNNPIEIEEYNKKHKIDEKYFVEETEDIKDLYDILGENI